jgi:hypothetical protein
MTYHDLSECTLNPEERAEEARRIVQMIAHVTEEMKQHEQDFVEKMDDCQFCSVKQLFWLRDLKDRYL